MTAGMAKLWLLVYSQAPRQRRGLDLALEGQNTDNTPKGVLYYALDSLVPVNGSMYSLRLI